MENKGCISRQHSNEYFTDEFLRSNLLQLLPDGYDICYLINNNNIIFYLYDSTVPLRELNSKDVIGYVNFYIDKEESDINISYLSVNENIEGFDLRRSGFGTYLLFIAILYSKTQGISKVTLDDMSDGYRTDHNIYLNMGFTYEDEDSGPEMEGDVDEIISYLDEFMDKYNNKTRIRLEELTEYFDDEEWEPDTEDDMDYYEDEDEMEYGGGSNIFYGGDNVDGHWDKRRKTGGKKKDLTYKLKCLEKCKCKRQRVKKKNMKYDMKQFEKNNKCYDKCYKRCFKKTLKKKGGTLNRRHSSAPASIQYTDKLPSQGTFHHIVDHQDAYDEFIRQLATDNDRYSLKSCLELKNYTEANRRSMLDPIVKKHVKKCSKAIVINKFFNFVKEEYDERPNIGLQIHVTYALEKYRQRCIDREHITGDKTNMLLATNMEKVIMESDYYNFTLPIRKILLEAFKGIISNGVDRGYIHNKKDPGAIIYGVILFNFVAILINKGLNEFRIIFMDIIQDLQNRLREIDIDEDIIDEVVIKFIKSLYWNKIILV